MTGLLLGLALCGFMTGVVVGSLRHDPHIWQHDLPEPLRSTLPPISDATRRRKSAWGVVMLVGLAAWVAGCVAATSTAWEAAVAAWIGFQLFNLYDAVVIDLGLIVAWGPRWAVPPELRRHPALLDWRWHLGAWAKGFAGGFVVGAIVWGIAAVVRAL